MTVAATTQPPFEERGALEESAARQEDRPEERIWQMTQDLLLEIQRTEGLIPWYLAGCRDPEVLQSIQAKLDHRRFQRLQVQPRTTPHQILSRISSMVEKDLQYSFLISS